MKRSEAEAIYDAGRKAVVDALMRFARHGHEQADEAQGNGRGDAEDEGRDLPERRQGVTLISASGEHLPAIVLDRAGDSLGLVVMIPVEPFSESDLEGMMLEFTIRGGHVLLGGQFACENHAEPEVLRLNGANVVEVISQREFVRVPLNRTVLLRRLDRDEDPIEGETVNLSAGGLLFDQPLGFEVDERVRFAIALPQGRPVRGEGRIVRQDDYGRPAVVFDSIGAGDRERLQEFLHSHELHGGFAPR